MGGNVFKGTTPVDQHSVAQVLAELQHVIEPLNTTLYVIGSCYEMPADKVTGDVDILINRNAVMRFFETKDESDARRQFRKWIATQGDYATAQSGSSVHVGVKVGDQMHQADLIMVQHPREISVFHRHTIPANSPYKGVHKQLALFWLAKHYGLCWSAFQGLYTRDKAGRRSNLLSIDADYVAYALLGGDASAQDLDCFETILSALDSQTAAQLMTSLPQDVCWKEPA